VGPKGRPDFFYETAVPEVEPSVIPIMRTVMKSVLLIRKGRRKGLPRESHDGVEGCACDDSF